MSAPYPFWLKQGLAVCLAPCLSHFSLGKIGFREVSEIAGGVGALPSFVD